MNRGEIRWYTYAAPDKRRPVLLLSRQKVCERLNEIIVVPISTTIRGLSIEVVLGPADGMLTTCALNFDHMNVAQRTRLGALICTLPDHRWTEVQAALLRSCGF